tara:strand:+ start:343 stop:786 length:444 start_codon:yes stop_codon:yes gene_type:complete
MIRFDFTGPQPGRDLFPVDARLGCGVIESPTRIPQHESSDLGECVQFDASESLLVDAGQAMERILREPPDLAVLDFRPRGLTGLDIVERVRKSANTSHLPILMITSSPTTEVVQKAVQLNVNGFVAKPFDLKSFGDRAIQIFRQSPP